jgi:hypothetical protein
VEGDSLADSPTVRLLSGVLSQEAPTEEYGAHLGEVWPQMMAALRSGAQYLVTRNVQDHRTAPLPALQPVGPLALL